MRSTLNRYALSALALAFLASSHAALADDEYRHHEHREGTYATVVAVRPIEEEVQVQTPRRECHEEEVTREGDNGNGGAVLGAIAGGAIGNAAGHNTQSRRLDTVVGVVAGAVIGNRMADSGSSTTTTTEERCTTRHGVQYVTRTVGYNVTYRFMNREYSARMDHDPGNEVRVVVDVRPAE